MKTYKQVLISSYGCRPHRGSENETGWQTIKDVMAYSERVTVVTVAEGQADIEAYRHELPHANVTFLYYSLPARFASLKDQSTALEQVVAYAWELGLFFFLRKRFRRGEFDLAHRATVGSYRFPSLLWRFGKTFHWGPISSGEGFPWPLLALFSLKGKLVELARMLFQRLPFVDPLVVTALHRAERITASTEATRQILPPRIRKKCVVIERYDKLTVEAPEGSRWQLPAPGEPLKLLHVGRLFEWKGIMLIFKALERLPPEVDYRYTLVGHGPDRDLFRAYATKKKLNVQFVDWMDRGELGHYYRTHSLYTAPDLHGRGGNAVMEAYLHGLPILTLDFVHKPNKKINFDYVVKTHRLTASQIINQTSELLKQAYFRQQA